MQSLSHDGESLRGGSRARNHPALRRARHPATARTFPQKAGVGGAGARRAAYPRRHVVDRRAIGTPAADGASASDLWRNCEASGVTVGTDRDPSKSFPLPLVTGNYALARGGQASTPIDTRSRLLRLCRTPAAAAGGACSRPGDAAARAEAAAAGRVVGGVEPGDRGRATEARRKGALLNPSSQTQLLQRHVMRAARRV